MQREQWNKKAKELIQKVYDKLEDHQRDWVGIYWVECEIEPEKDTDDLVVGPYIGPETPHKRIKKGEGLCGLAVESGATVNEPAVKDNPQFLACSTSTESEIVIPIRNQAGRIIGELDIDSNQKEAFDHRTQVWLELQCLEFGKELSE